MCAASTRRPTPAPAKRSIPIRILPYRLDVIGAVLTFLAAIIIASACGGDGEGGAPSPSRALTPLATFDVPSTGSDEPPERDLIDLARRFAGLANPPPELRLAAPVIGDDAEFELLILSANPDEPPERRTATATLRAVSEHAYFFIERGADVDGAEVEAAARVLEDEVWPTVTGAFGLPPIPGVDGDPRIAVLHADLGPAVGGYVSGEDAYVREVAAGSNQREVIYVNFSARPLGSSGYAQLVGHELQHLVHQEHDAGEESWVNEGLSQVAAGLLGGGGSYSAFLDRPDTQLNSWSSAGDSGAHYAASGLFFVYLLEQTGADARRLVAEPADGVDGVRAFLETTGSTRSFADLVADWAVANYLDEPEGPYGYGERNVSAPATKVVDGAAGAETEVRQFAADYLELRAEDFDGPALFVFEGDAEVPALAAQEEADGSFWWSNSGDNIDSTLTRELNLTGVRQATLTFRTWFDIECWYDYGYVAASRDGGRTWEALAGRETTTDDPLAVSYGPGYSGRSGGGETARWVEERIDLAGYAGSRILLRFEYVTDDSTNGSGWAIDDIAVPEIGFVDNGETDVGGWHREGFMRVTAPLAQRFALRLIRLGAAPTVDEIALDGRNRTEVPLAGLGSEYRRAVIVVMGVTEGTTEPAGYRYEVTTADG